MFKLPEQFTHIRIAIGYNASSFAPAILPLYAKLTAAARQLSIYESETVLSCAYILLLNASTMQLSRAHAIFTRFNNVYHVLPSACCMLVPSVSGFIR